MNEPSRLLEWAAPYTAEIGAAVQLAFIRLRSVWQSAAAFAFGSLSGEFAPAVVREFWPTLHVPDAAVRLLAGFVLFSVALELLREIPEIVRWWSRRARGGASQPDGKEPRS